MKLLNTGFALMILLILNNGVLAQNEDRLKEVQEMVSSEETEGWQKGVGAGLDFLQLLQINPRVGAGENRIQFGGIATAFATYTKNRIKWTNSGSLLLGVQKLGSGLLVENGQVTEVKKPFQKTIDELRLSSNFSYDLTDDSKFAYTLDVTFLSQILPTYPGNLLKDITETDQGPISKFMSPAQITVAPGISYIPSKNLSILISPASLKMIVVADDSIAAIPGDEDLMVGLHGTEWKSPTDYSKTLTQFGATLKAIYNNKYFGDKIIHKSELTLFSNYLQDPKNIDVDWRNEFSYEIFKNLHLSLNVNLLYDHDIPVQITDFDSPNGLEGMIVDGNYEPALGRRISLIESLAVKYNIVF